MCNCSPGNILEWGNIVLMKGLPLAKVRIRDEPESPIMTRCCWRIAWPRRQGAEAQPTSFGMAFFYASRDSSHAVSLFSKDFPTTPDDYVRLPPEPPRVILRSWVGTTWQLLTVGGDEIKAAPGPCQFEVLELMCYALERAVGRTWLVQQGGSTGESDQIIPLPVIYVDDGSNRTYGYQFRRTA